MGILNVTPDSFSDGCASASVEDHVGRALEMVRTGAAWIDIGGESTRPGAAAVPEAEELRRVVPVVKALRRFSDVAISIDTSKAAVANDSLEAGADAINDVTSLSDPDMASVVRKYGAGLVLMHGRGTPGTMDSLARYLEGMVAETSLAELMPRVEIALSTGIPRECIALDPGFGFAKTDAQNEELLHDLRVYAETGYPLLIGLSRKRFIGARLRARLGRDVPPLERDAESATAAAEAARRGAVVLRVHNIAATLAALGAT